MSISCQVPRILSIAGSDSSGGAGIQADIKTITALGGYAMTAVTAITAQNTTGVSDIHVVPVSTIKKQMIAVVDDIGVDVIKTGMLVSDAIISMLAKTLPAVPLIIDPVMVSTSGCDLMDESAKIVLVKDLFPKALLVTPNIPEAQWITGKMIESEDDMIDAGKEICGLGANAVLIKGGHLPGDKSVDILIHASGDIFKVSSIKLQRQDTHGTGCTLASAIAYFIGSGLSLEDAVKHAHHYVHQAMKQAPALGQGNGPLWHMHPYKPKN